MHRIALIGVTALALGPGAASAAIVVDPDAPAGSQYSAPLDRARAEGGDGGTAGAPGSTEQAPPFGEGIDRQPPGGANTSETQTGSEPPSADSASGASGDGGAWTLVAALVLAVLVAGGLLAFALRRRTPVPSG